MAVAAYRLHGRIPATCSIFGEGKLPRDTVRLWNLKGIETINIVYDLDTVGKKAAAQVLRELSTHFQVRLQQLPAELGEHADICDLYMWHGVDNDAFRQALADLPEAVAKIPPPSFAIPFRIVKDSIPSVTLAPLPTIMLKTLPRAPPSTMVKALSSLRDEKSAFPPLEAEYFGGHL